MRVVNCNLSDSSFGGWRAFADTHGTTISALLEVLGLELTAGAPHHRPLELELVAVRARELSQARKRRRPDPPEPAPAASRKRPGGR